MSRALFAVVLLAMAGTAHAQGLTVTTDGFEEGVNQSINQGESIRLQREAEARARAEAHRREHPELYQTPAASAKPAAPKGDGTKRYVCMVYCVGRSGTTNVTVSAKSTTDAASQASDLSDRVCQNADYAGATRHYLKPSQCRQE
ncbi:MAG: hypothetical protein EPN26_15650 [Rhodospirillales bacterium]|nr:MAG: hypothetical protein EPN26_15650 [Rhodospirillales bacterium]